MHRVSFTLLRPFMRLLHFRTEQRMRHLPRPVDAPRAHAPGPHPDRILLFGSGPAMGYGVLSNDLALPGHLARQLSAITGRGVDVELVSAPDMTIATSAARLREVNVGRYDAIVLTVGVNDVLTLTPAPVWRASMTDVLGYLMEQVSQRTRVIVVAVPPIRSIDTFTSGSGRVAERHALTLNHETRRIVQSVPNVTYVPFAPLARADGVRYRSTETYQQWATIIVAPLSQQLMREPRNEDRGGVDESTRQAALDSMGILDTPREQRFDRIATLATQLLETEFSAVLFVDHERHWIKAAENVGDIEIRREGSFGNVTIASGGLLVVPDARLDPRFRDNPHVSGQPHIVFYAGYPIETAFGALVGVVSVYDRATRHWTDQDAKILRDLALMVQRELETNAGDSA